MSKAAIATVISVEELEGRQRALAYQMWEDEGRPEGKAEEHWDRAGLLMMELDATGKVTNPEWLKRGDQPADKSKAAVPATTPVLKPLDRPTVIEGNSHISAKRSAA
jgi:Protein of unknown function (DUF2934)